MSVPSNSPAQVAPPAQQPASSQPQPAASQPAAAKPAAAKPGAPKGGPGKQPIRPPASPASMKPRHYGLAISFALAVILPLLVSAWYLHFRAADQYASYVGFSVRSESAPGASDILGGLGSLVGVTSSSTSDTDILYKFIQSRDLVERVNARIDLREVWSKAPDDPVFRFRGGQSLEDLSREWDRKVRIHFDTGMIDLRILAFTPEDAQAIAKAILDEGGILINELNDVAREDALRYARQELDRAESRLREARTQMTEFRNRYQLVDPAADVQGQVGVVSSLQQQLAEQLVALGLLRANAQDNDPRIAQTELRISVIREQIEAERLKIGSVNGERALSDLVGEFETLAVERQFAETSYTTALASYEAARAEAARQSRYLAPYIRPTLAQDAEFPERGTLLAMIFGFLSLIWIIGTLVFYSLRDRR
ncbi:sugar transporter [Paracoccus sp. (in: a-proteobacteria)]|uniref:sugar transporter n=1 Tax=Paracoccus sp. TaxID=267 RepID=UPI002729AACA|nr:sugar transporter [Paracoccus sp. (in: a-proteobacteria)]